MVVTYPLLQVVDDSGAIVTGATVTIASVVDKAGSAIASPGAAVNLAGACVSVDYDAESKGEAWITLAISKVGSTFTGANAAPSFYLARDSGRTLSGINASGQVALSATGLDAVDAAEPTVAANGAPSTWNFRRKLLWTFCRLYRPGKTPTALTTKTSSGVDSTVQAITTDGAGTDSVGAAS